jgi:hypothetical protein
LGTPGIPLMGSSEALSDAVFAGSLRPLGNRRSEEDLAAVAGRQEASDAQALEHTVESAPFVVTWGVHRGPGVPPSLL